MVFSERGDVQMQWGRVEVGSLSRCVFVRVRACARACVCVRVCVGKQWGLDPRTVARVSWPWPEYRMREAFGDRKGQSSIFWFSHPLASGGAMAGATRPPATFVILCLGRASKESSGVPLPFHSRGPGGPPQEPCRSGFFPLTGLHSKELYFFVTPIPGPLWDDRGSWGSPGPLLGPAFPGG